MTDTMTNEQKVDFELISREEKFWRDFKKKTEDIIFANNQEKEINEKILEFAEEKIKGFQKIDSKNENK